MHLQVMPETVTEKIEKKLLSDSVGWYSKVFLRCRDYCFLGGVVWDLYVCHSGINL